MALLDRDREVLPRTVSHRQDRPRQVPLPRCDEYVDHDYIHHDDRVDRERLLRPRVNDHFHYLLDFVYFHDVDYYVYFLHVPKISFFSAVNPKLPSLRKCAPKPQPYISMPYFL